MSQLFSAVDYTPALGAAIVANLTSLMHLPNNVAWSHVPWDANWDESMLLDRLTIWTPPPEMAAQAIAYFLSTWVERPLTTHAIFILPRILQRSRSRLSKYAVTVLACLQPEALQASASLPHPPHLLPIALVYVRTHLRTLPTLHRSDMDGFSKTPRFRWHRQQAELLRRLPLAPHHGG